MLVLNNIAFVNLLIKKIWVNNYICVTQNGGQKAWKYIVYQYKNWDNLTYTLPINNTSR